MRKTHYEGGGVKNSKKSRYNLVNITLQFGRGFVVTCVIADFWRFLTVGANILALRLSLLNNIISPTFYLAPAVDFLYTSVTNLPTSSAHLARYNVSVSSVSVLEPRVA